MPARVSVLFLGDIIGRPGRRALERFLPSLVERYSPSLIIANGENAAGGSGITEEISQELLHQIDVLTSGNHIWDKKETIAYFQKEPRLLRPANYPPLNPGKGFFVHDLGSGLKVAVVSLQGRVFMEPIDCPFRTADDLLGTLQKTTPIIIVDFHAEATSEKQAMGWYLDGRVSAVVGTHTHVQTSDERILPQGTAYISDVGMVGGYNSVIGMRREQALARFLTGRAQRFEPAKEGLSLGAVFIELDAKTGKAISICREALVEERSED